MRASWQQLRKQPECYFILRVAKDTIAATTGDGSRVRLKLRHKRASWRREKRTRRTTWQLDQGDAAATLTSGCGSVAASR